MSETAPNTLRDLTVGPQTVSVPSPGTGGWYPLTPTIEPSSVGAPPLAPSLVRGVSRQIESRILRSRSNHVATSALETAARPTFELVWGAVSTAERDQLVTFLESTAGNGLSAFDVRLDGPGSSVTKVRALSYATTQLPKGTHDVTARVEEVY
ncbi:MAG: hypothetical protein AMXMBFR58_29660 [Phycisphaerae bacterium]